MIEVFVMEEYLVNEGIVRKWIEMEMKFKRIEENIKYSNVKFNLGKIVIVISDYYMYRVLMLVKC